MHTDNLYFPASFEVRCDMQLSSSQRKDSKSDVCHTYAKTIDSLNVITFAFFPTLAKHDGK